MPDITCSQVSSLGSKKGIAVSKIQPEKMGSLPPCDHLLHMENTTAKGKSFLVLYIYETGELAYSLILLAMDCLIRKKGLGKVHILGHSQAEQNLSNYNQTAPKSDRITIDLITEIDYKK